MQPLLHQDWHLTYCSKVHPGHGWDTVFGSLQKCLPDLKRRICATASFGLGLRLSAAECETLLAPGRMAEFKDFLAAHDLYVFTINGFPFGAFHGTKVKADVFAPDWRSPSRLIYTIRLARILAALLPPSMPGSISTLPLSYKPWIIDQQHQAYFEISRNLCLLTRELIALREKGGPCIHVDLEPEPDGLVENTKELAEFFQKWLLPYGGRQLAAMAGISADQAREALLEHLQVCLDTCHMAVTYEDPQESLQILADNGIKVGKVQITNGWRLDLPAAATARQQLAGELLPYAASPYLHQVVGQDAAGAQVHYRDLTYALAGLAQAAESQWRIHYHLPLFVEQLGSLQTTHQLTRDMLKLLKTSNYTNHLEMETYTWEQLPAGLKLDLVDSLEKEYRWVLDILTGINQTAPEGPKLG